MVIPAIGGMALATARAYEFGNSAMGWSGGSSGRGIRLRRNDLARHDAPDAGTLGRLRECLRHRLGQRMLKLDDLKGGSGSVSRSRYSVSLTGRIP